MTDQERQLISELADRIQNAPAPQIDPEADNLIRRTIGVRPDALYILVQTVLMQQMALNQQRPASFLPDYQQPPQYQQQPQYQPQRGMFSNFLHNAATTAAGVIAGELAFDSLASLFGHRGGGGSGFMGGGNDFYTGPGDTDQPSQFASFADDNQDISPDIEDERDDSGSSFDV
jgi:hypothetical protein